MQDDPVFEDKALQDALSAMLASAAQFLIALRAAYREQQPEGAMVQDFLIVHGATLDMRLTLGRLLHGAPRLEVGVSHEGEFRPFFQWAPPADAPNAATMN